MTYEKNNTRIHTYVVYYWRCNKITRRCLPGIYRYDYYLNPLASYVFTFEIGMYDGIHILKGTGDNCTCYDCVVLYGGECDSTEDNNILDVLEENIVNYLNFTPTGRPRKTSDYYMDSCIEKVVMPIVVKYLKIKKNQFYHKYYSFMPLLYLMTSDRKLGARYFYRRTRNWMFNDFKKGVLLAPTTPVNTDND